MDTPVPVPEQETALQRQETAAWQIQGNLACCATKAHAMLCNLDSHDSRRTDCKQQALLSLVFSRVSVALPRTSS